MYMHTAEQNNVIERLNQEDFAYLPGYVRTSPVKALTTQMQRELAGSQCNIGT